MLKALTKPLKKSSSIPRMPALFSLSSGEKNSKFKLFILLVLFLFFNFGCALHKDVVTLDNRIGELRLRIITLENQTSQLKSMTDGIKKRTEEIKNIEDEKEKKIRGQTAGQYAEIERRKEEVRMLNGRLEELDHLLKQKLKTIEETDKKTDGRLAHIEETAATYNNKLARLEQYLSLDLEGREKATAPVPAAAPDEKKQITEDEMYASALKLYDGEKYAATREKLQELLARYPNSDKADNCQFWIGESYYQEKWYEKAIVEYQKVIEKYPKGNKIKASFLKQGLSFFNLGDKKNAKLVLSELIEKFPNSNEAKIAAGKLKGF